MRIDSEDERESLGHIFPVFNDQKYTEIFGEYPVELALTYEVSKVSKRSNEIKGLWTGTIGWKGNPRSLDIVVEANWQFEPQMGWNIEIEISPQKRRTLYEDVDLFDFEFTQKRSKTEGKVNVRHAVCKTMGELIKEVD